MDSDDAYLPHKLGFVADYFTHHPEIDVLVDSYEKIDPIERGGRHKLRVNPVFDNSAAVTRDVYSRRLNSATPAISVRRHALLGVGLFDETLTRHQDVDILLRLAGRYRCATTDQILWTKYWTAGAITSARHTFIAATLEICQRHPDDLRRFGAYCGWPTTAALTVRGLLGCRKRRKAAR